MKAKVYVIAGVLDSGKTTWINEMLLSAKNSEDKLLVIQLEDGERCIWSGDRECARIMIPIHEFLLHKEEWEEKLYQYIERTQIQTIYLEWNGIVPFEEAEGLLLQGKLRKLCEIKQVIYIIKSEEVLQVTKGMGNGPTSQISNADLILFNGEMGKEEKQLLREINPSARMYSEKDVRNRYNDIVGQKESPYIGLALVTTALFILALLFPIFFAADHRVGDCIQIFIGLMLQGIPFLLIGVMLSSFIQVFLRREIILKWFPKKKWIGLMVAVAAGFCLPVCDCASIPIFKSLVRKGIPLYVAVTFMFAAPVINPVVMLSTFYAFNGDISIVAVRVLLGIIASVGIGVVISIVTDSSKIGKRTWGYERCNCGCNEEFQQDRCLREKMKLFLRHSQLEFLDVGRYLLLGTFLSAVFQVVQSEQVVCVCEWPFAVRLLLMMALSFSLSLCSSADAVVAKGFVSEFSLAAVMGFLVFGPMLDIKNVLMLQSGFTKRFIAKLVVVTVVVCFVVVAMASMVWKGGI